LHYPFKEGENVYGAFCCDREKGWTEEAESLVLGTSLVFETALQNMSFYWRHIKQAQLQSGFDYEETYKRLESAMEETQKYINRLLEQ